MKCEQCGKPVPKGRRKFCSDKCSKIYFGQLKITPKLCEHCGKKVPKGRSIYCSDECRLAHYGITNRVNKTCEICGKELTGYQKKYCSVECKNVSQGKINENKTCEICGKPLTGNRMCFCSNECARQARLNGKYKHDKDQWKKPKEETKKRGRPKKVPSIIEINARAKALGLTYGQYVGLCRMGGAK